MKNQKLTFSPWKFDEEKFKKDVLQFIEDNKKRNFQDFLLPFIPDHKIKIPFPLD